MKRQRKAVADLMAAITESFDTRRENPSRYEIDGSLKPLCSPEKHKPYGRSTKCEICGLVVRGSGANLPLAPGKH